MAVTASPDQDPYVRERILNLALEVGAADTLNQIFTRALSRVDELMHFDLATIALVDEGAEELVFREMNYRSPGQGGIRSLVGRRVPMDERNVFGWVATAGRPHLRRHLDDPFPFETVQDSEEVVSHIIVPMIGHTDIVGVLAIGSLKADSYDEIDMAIASQFARLIGLAIANLRTHERVTELALRDGLTGAYNHRQFQDMLGHELGRLSRYGGDLALMLLDVDNFKVFNDCYGHPAGDRVLKQTVTLLAQHLRSADLLFRYGGEEFAILLPGTPVCDAHRVAEKLVKLMRDKNHLKPGGKERVTVTVSIGLSAASEENLPSRESLIQQADTALYQAKQKGKDCVVVYQEQPSG